MSREKSWIHNDGYQGTHEGWFLNSLFNKYILLIEFRLLILLIFKQ